METTLTPLQRIAYDTVDEITGIKRGKTEPCVAHISEIRNSLGVELLEALRSLCRRDILAVRLDLNKNPMFSIKTPLQ